MNEAIRDQINHARQSKLIDRSGWTRQQWVEDARAQMHHIDGSVLDLVNGHPLRMLEEIDVLRNVLTFIAEAAGRVTGDWAEASPEVRTQMRERLLRAEGAAWEVLRPMGGKALVSEGQADG